jgi:MbtH protein
VRDLDCDARSALAVEVAIVDNHDPMSTAILDDDTAAFLVVVNGEEQYSIWPAERELPAGWSREGTSGIKVWTDMRPKSLRDCMAANAD